jgi:hypothetical protein
MAWSWRAPHCRALLLVALVAVPGQDGMALALGRWRIGPGQPVPPASPLLLRPADLGVALALLAQAEAALPAATLEPGETVTLAREARLLVELAAVPPEGTPIHKPALKKSTPPKPRFFRPIPKQAEPISARD